MEQSEQSMQSESINEIAGAVCKMQQTKLFAITDSKNPFFNSKYADLSSVWSAIREPLTENGLSIIQTTEPYPDGVIVVTTLMHNSGEWIRGRLAGTVVADKKGIRTPQGMLSLITYLRRAGLSAMVGVCPEDDDGESVSGRGSSVPEHARTKTSKSDKTKPSAPELADDVRTMIDYAIPKESSQAFADLKAYKPPVVILNKERTHLKVGKFEVMITSDGKKVWTDAPKFGSSDFDVSASVPCLVAALLREESAAFIGGKYDLVFTSEEDE